MKNDFEYDKIAVAVALAIFTIVFSSSLGGFLYRTTNLIDKKGFEIEVTDSTGGGSSAPKGLPDVLDMAAIMAAANAELGKTIFNKCATCHTPGKGEANKVGPNLWGIVNAATGRHTEFAYSSAMKQRTTDGKKWTYEELYRYIYAPKAHVPGTKMAFAGVKKDDERANLIAYLRTLADSPEPLPKS